MRKKKIDFRKYADEHNEAELIGRDGTKILVRDHISYENKIQLCKDVIENCVMVHDDSCCYEGINIHAERIKAVVQYYTNVQTDGAEAEAVCDFVINNGLIGQIRDYIHDDYYELEDVYVTMLNMVMGTFEDDASLAKAVRNSFGFLFTGKDITEDMAQAEATKSVLFDAIGALRNLEKEKEEKIDAGKLSVGGNIINFAKKTE